MGRGNRSRLAPRKRPSMSRRGLLDGWPDCYLCGLIDARSLLAGVVCPPLLSALSRTTDRLCADRAHARVAQLRLGLSRGNSGVSPCTSIGPYPGDSIARYGLPRVGLLAVRAKPKAESPLPQTTKPGIRFATANRGRSQGPSPLGPAQRQTSPQSAPRSAKSDRKQRHSAASKRR